MKRVTWPRGHCLRRSARCPSPADRLPCPIAPRRLDDRFQGVSGHRRVCPPWRSRSSWPSNVSLIDSMTWRSGLKNRAPARSARPCGPGQGVRIEAVLPGRARLAGAGIGLEEQVRDSRGPALPGRLEVADVFKIAKQVSSAPGVQCAGQVGVAGVPVAHQYPGAAGQDPAGAGVAGGPPGHVQVSEVTGAGHAGVRQALRGPGGGLISVQRRGGAQQRRGVLHERRQRGGCAAADRGHPPGRDLDPRHLAQQQRGPQYRHVMAADQVRRVRPGLRPVHHPAGHIRRDLPGAGRLTARAHPGDLPVPGDVRRGRRGDVPPPPALCARRRLPSGPGRTGRIPRARTRWFHPGRLTALTSCPARRAACRASARSSPAATGPCSSSRTGCR